MIGRAQSTAAAAPAPFPRGSRCALLVCALAGCRGAQSALDPAGEGAARIATLFWVMLAGSGIIWLGMMALTVAAIRARPEAQSQRRTALLIIGGGAILPTVVLTALLIYGLALLPELVAPAPPGSLQLKVTGEMWWWRVRYVTSGGVPVELANELHLPLAEPADLRLDSADVIHSFWIPSLGGKLDMFPGRTTRLSLRPTRAGVFRGVCAEYCGTSHALMGLHAVVEDRASFERWLAHQAEPARAPADPLAARGAELFIADGCGGCHTIRGTSAGGVIGPDLTHVGSRQGLGAGLLANDPPGFLRWIQHTESIKPGSTMPSFGMLPEDDLRALAAYLEGLQ
jgi:cytochrome c oxidase subunit 2